MDANQLYILQILKANDSNMNMIVTCLLAQVIVFAPLGQINLNVFKLYQYIYN
jgi:hypothetical protein